jgi:methylated-DNA-[protein]-cysteine S-methyltransferase
VCFDDVVRLQKWLDRWYPGEPVHEAAAPTDAANAMRRYFAGEVGALDPLAIELKGTPFQLRVWNTLRAVRAGRTTSYMELACTMGAPSAVRAVGAANGANPIAIVIPCHRVIGSNGALTGYGGGIERKRWLLQHEGAASVLF